MWENPTSSLIINNQRELMSNTVSSSLKSSGIDVTYLSAAFGRFPLHDHRYIQTAVPLETSGFESVTLSAVGSRRNSQRLNSENVFVVPAYQPHTLLWDEETKLILFHLEPEFVELAADEAVRGAVEIREEGDTSDPFITQIGLAIYEEFKKPTPVGKIYIESLAAALAVHLVRNYSVAARRVREFSGGLTGARRRRATEFVNAHLDESLSLTQLAEIAGMSAYHFSRALKKSTGFTPHAYVVHQRMARAKQLLTETKMPITEVAAAVGYGNYNHFSTQFRKLVGVSPSAYRTR